jgi:hypothetical protein
MSGGGVAYALEGVAAAAGNLKGSGHCAKDGIGTTVNRIQTPLSITKSCAFVVPHLLCRRPKSCPHAFRHLKNFII